MESSLPEVVDSNSVFDFTAFPIYKSVTLGPRSQTHLLSSGYDVPHTGAQDYNFDSVEPTVLPVESTDLFVEVTNKKNGFGSFDGSDSLKNTDYENDSEVDFFNSKNNNSSSSSGSSISLPDYDYAGCCSCGCDDGDAFALALARTHLRLTIGLQNGAVASSSCDFTNVAADVITAYMREQSSSISCRGDHGFHPSGNGTWTCSALGNVCGSGATDCMSFAIQLYRDSSAASSEAGGTYIVEWQRRRGNAISFGNLFDNFATALERRFDVAEKQSAAANGGVSVVVVRNNNTASVGVTGCHCSTVPERRPMGPRKRCWSPPSPAGIALGANTPPNFSPVGGDWLLQWAADDAVEAMGGMTAMLADMITAGDHADANALRMRVVDFAMNALETASDSASEGPPCTSSSTSEVDSGTACVADVQCCGLRNRNWTVLKSLQCVKAAVTGSAEVTHVQTRLRQPRALSALVRCVQGGCSVSRFLAAEVLCVLNIRVSSAAQSPKASSTGNRGFTVPAAAASGVSSAPVSRGQLEMNSKQLAPVHADSAEVRKQCDAEVAGKHTSSNSDSAVCKPISSGTAASGITSSVSADATDEVEEDVSPTSNYDLFLFNA